MIEPVQVQPVEFSHLLYNGHYYETVTLLSRIIFSDSKLIPQSALTSFQKQIRHSAFNFPMAAHNYITVIQIWAAIIFIGVFNSSNIKPFSSGVASSIIAKLVSINLLLFPSETHSEGTVGSASLGLITSRLTTYQFNNQL